MNLLDTTSEQPSPGTARAAYEASYGRSISSDWLFHDVQDPLLRYLRDRRLRIAVARALQLTGRPAAELTALVVCGGVGGEGTFLKNAGFREVTVSDFSAHALAICRARDRRLHTLLLDAEQTQLADGSFDVVLVQDGLHELHRPPNGLTEMLRLSRLATIVIEPHEGIVARLFGTRWEFHEGVVNYVFRWNRREMRDVVYSYLRDMTVVVSVTRLWDHNVVVGRLARAVGGGWMGLMLARATYQVLDTLAGWLGNMMVAVIVRAGRAQRTADDTHGRDHVD